MHGREQVKRTSDEQEKVPEKPATLREQTDSASVQADEFDIDISDLVEQNKGISLAYKQKGGQ